MIEYWEVIALMTVFYVFLTVQVDRSFREMHRKLAGISSTLDRLEDKIDGHDRSSYRVNR
jgi:hypothetical protein